MKNTKLRDNLKRLMKLHGKLNLSELARDASIPQPTLHHILSGSTKTPRRTQLEKLANCFSVSIKQLLGLEPMTNIFPAAVREEFNLNLIPLISWADVRKWPHIICESAGPKYIISNDLTSKRAFALTIEESHAIPVFQKGSIVIFDPELDPQNNDFVLVEFEQDRSLKLVRMHAEGNAVYLNCYDAPESHTGLVPLNNYENRILATAVESRVRLGMFNSYMSKTLARVTVD